LSPGIGCTDPQPPNLGTNLILQHEFGTVVEIGLDVSLTCAANTFFESDYYKTEELITCLDGNVWSTPTENCVPGKMSHNNRSFTETVI